MKLDPTVMRTMDRKDFRVLEAVENGMRNYALVPGPLVATLSNLRHGGSGKIISSLLRDKLISHETKKGGHDGYRLTNAGYDVLALFNLKQRGFVAALGDRIGTGKESDVYLGVSKDGKQYVLKLHRLGRTSFRNVRQKRDYFGNNAGGNNSWLFLSRLSAIKEFAFMKALHNVNYPTPTPIAHNRHIVVMSLVRGVPLYQIIPSRMSPDQAQSIFQQATQMAVRLAQHGLVHCDLNEFNLLVDMSGIQASVAEDDDAYVRHSGMSVAASRGALSGMGPWDEQYTPVEEVEEDIPTPIAVLDNGEPKPVVTLIDFPQMVSTQHPNAKELYERDLECLRQFFVTKMQCRIPEEEFANVAWEKAVEDEEGEEEDEDGNDEATVGSKLKVRLDLELRASGYSEEDSKRDLELFYFESNEKLMHSILPEEGEDSEEDDESPEDDINEAVSGNANGEINPPGNNDTEVPEPQEEPSVQVTIDTKARDDTERRKLEQKAKARVKKQLEDQKKKGKKKGAFRSRNSNKSYVKGKRVMQDFGI